MSEEQQKKPRNDKPVVTYIAILFIAAFLLMALSFFMHQRSNTEALGELQSSMTAMQEVQATQEENIALQQQLSDLQEELDKTIAAYDGQLTALVGDLEQKQLELDAMTSLYRLEQACSAEDYETCRQIILAMEANGEVACLDSKAGAEGAASPADRFLQLKEAAETQQAQPGEEPAPAE